MTDASSRDGWFPAEYRLPDGTVDHVAWIRLDPLEVGWAYEQLPALCPVCDVPLYRRHHPKAPTVWRGEKVCLNCDRTWRLKEEAS